MNGHSWSPYAGDFNLDYGLFSLDHFAFLQVKDEVSQVVDMIHGILIVCGVA